MPGRQIALTAAECQALLDRRDHAALLYVGERAAILLKVADGMPAAAVARHGLLRPREPVCESREERANPLRNGLMD